MLIGMQVTLVGDWLAETKCHANPTVAHFLKGRPYAIYYFTISSEVFRTLIIYRPFREDDRLSQLHKLLASLIIAQHINEEFFFRYHIPECRPSRALRANIQPCVDHYPKSKELGQANYFSLSFLVSQNHAKAMPL